MQYLIEAPYGESKIEKLFVKSINLSDYEKVKILAQIWKFYKQKYFGSKMSPAGTIRFSKDTGKTFRQRGAYWPTRNQLVFSKRLFNAPFEKFREVFLHEMCHQATTLISNVPKEHHGPIWKKWMVKCGLNPNRLDYESNVTYMTQKEKEVHKEVVKKFEKAVKTTKQIYYPTENKPAKWFNKDKQVWVEGLLCCKSDLAGKKWAHIKEPYGGSWMNVPSTWFYEVDKKNEKLYLTKNWLDAAQRVRDSVQKRRDVRKERKALKRSWGF